MALAIVFSAVILGLGSFVNIANAEGTSDMAITSFRLSGNDGVIILSSIAVTVPSGTDVTALAPTIMITGASVSPASGVAQNFTNPVTYTVTAGDGSTHDYVVTVTATAVVGGQVEVSLASDNPKAKLMVAGATVTLASFNFLATTTEDVELDYLYLTQVTTDTNLASYKDYDEIWFMNEAGVEVAGTRMSPTSAKPKIEFSDGTFVVPVNDSDGVNIYLQAKLADIGNGSNGVSGHYLGYEIADVATDMVAKGRMSGSGALVFAGATAPTGLIHYVYKGYPAFVEEPLSTNNLHNGMNDLFKFTVYALNSDIALYKFTFDITANGAVFSDLYVYDVTDPDEKKLNITAGTAPLGIGIWESSGWDGIGVSDNQVTVSQIQPRTFVVRGNVVSADETALVFIHLAGDADLVAGTDTLMHSATEVDNDANDNFIWSDMSADNHTTGTDDWTNGYLVSGLSLTSETTVIAVPDSETENLVINLNVEANEYRVKLIWENLNPEGNDSIAYTIYRSTSTLVHPSWNDEVAYIKQDNVTEVQDFNLEPGVDYYYFVSASNHNSSKAG